MRTILICLVILAASVAGCAENLRDLKDRMSPAATEDPEADARALEAERQLARSGARANDSLRPPVARVTVFGENGALVYKSSFVGENVTAPILVEAGAALTLIATDSEAIQRGATIVTYAWSVAGADSTGPRAPAQWNDSGAYRVKLIVTDSNGLTDEQTLVLAVPPRPFDVTTNRTTGAVAGAASAGQSGAVKFDLALADAKVPASIRAVKVTTPAVDSCDVVLSVLDADGKAVGASDKGGLGAMEEAVLGALAEGAYTVNVGVGDACAAHEGIVVSMVVTYVPIIDGLSGDAHAGHSH